MTAIPCARLRRVQAESRLVVILSVAKDLFCSMQSSQADPLLRSG